MEAPKLVKQARLELAVSPAELLHIAGLSRLSPPAWLAFAVSFRTSTLALAGVADLCKAVRCHGAHLMERCTSVGCRLLPGGSGVLYKNDLVARVS